METKNLIIMFAVAIVALVVLVGARNISDGSNYTATNQVSTNYAMGASNVQDTEATTGEVQNVKLSAQGYTYIVTPSILKKGIPVRMEVDLSTVTGCLRSVVIPDFGVLKNVYEGYGKNIIEFTPDKAGTFNMRCSMNMGHGTFQVTE